MNGVWFGFSELGRAAGTRSITLKKLECSKQADVAGIY